MEIIQGIVDHIIFRSDTTGYTVFNMIVKKKEITCVATAPSIDEGESLRAEGEFVNDSRYGRQFRVRALAVETPEDETAIERYLGSGAIKGVGPVLAAKIVSAFKKDTFRVIEEEPERLVQIKGISERKAQEIYAQFHEKQGLRQAMVFLANYGISVQLSMRIYKQYGEQVYQIISENPYKLAEDMSGIGFKLADEIALHAGFGRDSAFRIRSGIIYVMQQAALSGHTCFPEDSLIRYAARILAVSEEIVGEQLTALAVDHRIIRKQVEGQSMVYASAYYFLELETARKLIDLASVDYSIDPLETDRVIAGIEKREGLTLDEQQKQAVKAAASSGLLVITGGPGTGKTTTIRAIIRYFELEGMEIRLAAPTGRAAKRMTETSGGYEAQTIHRLLEVAGIPDEMRGARTRFERNEENPLETDVVIIDEMSMVDLFLMNSLVKAIPMGTRLILVGDVNQLPSVGPGNVLGDVIASGCFETVTLTKIFRQALESDIVKNAHMINGGEQILLDNRSRDFFCLQMYDVMQILSTMIALVRDKLPSYVNARPYDIQVLTPMRKGELGVERLNTVLQRYLNPADSEKKEHTFHGGILRTEDKVMQIRNDYQLEWEVVGKYNIVRERGTGVFNGDMGIVLDINDFAEEVTVEYDECRQVHYSFQQLDELELAYAVTVHKAQGSEYPAVVIPLLNGPAPLMNRNILYTAVTRARNCVAIVGSEETVRSMIDNERQQHRYTTLHLRIREQEEADRLVE